MCHDSLCKQETRQELQRAHERALHSKARVALAAAKFHEVCVRESERENVCVCVCACACVCVCVYVKERGREDRERERGRESVCVRM